MKLGTHLCYAYLKGQQLPRPTVRREKHHQSAHIAYYLCTFIENNLNMISMNTDPSKLSLYMNIDMNMHYTYFRYQLPWAIVHLVSLNNKLFTFYLCPLSSVSSPVLIKYYESKWPSVAMASTSSVDPQNCRRFSLLELL